MAWARFFSLCAAAGGVVRIAATARAAGLDPGTVRRRAVRERWWLPYPDVAAPPGTPIDTRTRALAAVRYLQGRGDDAGPGLAAATRWTGAYLLGVRRSAPSRPQIVVPHHRRPSPRRDLEVVRGRGLTAADVQDVDGVPTVTPPRLLRDLGAVADYAALRAVTIDLLQKRHLRPKDLAAVVAGLPAARGRARLRAVLQDLEEAGRTDSPMEFEARDRLTTDGIPLDPGQVAVPLVGGGVIHIDLGIAAICFAIEADSFGFHSRREDVTRDARRANAVAEVDADWRVLHLTWEIMRDDWAGFVRTAREVVAAQSRRHLGLPWPVAAQAEASRRRPSAS